MMIDWTSITTFGGSLAAPMIGCMARQFRAGKQRLILFVTGDFS
jgi:hypothetical protein